MKAVTVAGVGGAVLVLAGAAWLFVRDRGANGPDLAANGASAAARPASGASGAGGAVSVSVVTAARRDVDVQLSATGSVTPLSSVDIKSQVSSVVAKVHIRDGQFVRKGELLFTLDARSDEANLAKAQAQLQKDLAALADAQRQLGRSRELFAQNFIAQGAVDTNQALVEAQQAAVAADRAAIDAVRVSLSYSRIVAPGAGRAGAVSVVAGSFVQPGSAPLVTITQLDPIGVAFNLPQRNLPDALAALHSGAGAVSVALPEGRGTALGKLQFVDNLVDATSGTVRVKAEFDNRDQKLWPGAFVGVSLKVQTLKGAIVVPQAAIVQSPRGRVVFVVEADQKAGVRPVELVQAIGSDAVVTGLAGGEKVIVEGRQNVRPGNAVVERPGAGGRDPRGAGAASAASGAGNGAVLAAAASGVTP